MRKEHLDAVLKDLRENREILIGNLTHLNSTIGFLEHFYQQPQVKPLELPGSVTRKQVETVAARVSAEVTMGGAVVEAEKNFKPGMIGLVAAIEQAAATCKFNQLQLAREVLRLRPGTNLGSAQTQISQMLSQARLHKGNDGNIRNVKDGKIQGLPPACQDSLLEGSHRFTQYERQ